MDGASLDELRDEIATLEATEKQISAERRRLHHQIDYGFANAATLAREREVSDERRRLHQRIDSLRERLRARGAPAGSDSKPAAPDPSPSSAFSEWSGVAPEIVAAEAAYEELEP